MEKIQVVEMAYLRYSSETASNTDRIGSVNVLESIRIGKMPTALQHIDRNMFRQAGVLVPSTRDNFKSMPARELRGL
jgi:hypothetical protein